MSKLMMKMLGFKEFLFLPCNAAVRFGDFFHAMYTWSLAICPYGFAVPHACQVVLERANIHKETVVWFPPSVKHGFLLTRFYF